MKNTNTSMFQIPFMMKILPTIQISEPWSEPWYGLTISLLLRAVCDCLLWNITSACLAFDFTRNNLTMFVCCFHRLIEISL